VEALKISLENKISDGTAKRKKKKYECVWNLVTTFCRKLNEANTTENDKI